MRGPVADSTKNGKPTIKVKVRSSQNVGDASALRSSIEWKGDGQHEEGEKEEHEVCARLPPGPQTLRGYVGVDVPE